MLVESGKGGVDQVVGCHDGLAGEVVDGATGAVPELGADGSGEDGLDLDALVADLADLVVEGLSEAVGVDCADA